MASEPVHVSEVLDGPLCGCPACGGVGVGEADGRVVECDYCRGTGKVTLDQANYWEAKHPWSL